MLKIPYYKQETPDDCGPASLQMVFEFLGKKISQKELAQRLGTGATVWASNERMEEIAREEGLSTFMQTSGTIEGLRKFLDKGIPVIVNFIEPEGDGHFAPVLGVTEKEIIFNDPWHGEKYTLSLEYFVQNWRSFEGNREKWLLAISQSTL